jgi:tetratricopeptide (TPR) repeat protein
VTKIFFSSCLRDPADIPLPIRDSVNALNGPFDRDDAASVARLPIWLSNNQRRLDKDLHPPPLEIAEVCVDAVRESDVYVAVLRSRWGSEIEIAAGEAVQVSFLELELFEAALERKPAYVFLLDDGELSDRLKSLLNLLEPALPGFERKPLSEKDIIDRIQRVLDQQSRPRLIDRARRAIASGRRMVERLTEHRYRPYDPRSEGPGIRFLGGLTDPTANRPSPEHIDHILARADAAEDYNTRLTFLWMALRELMGASPDDPDASAFLPQWEAALGAWTATGAWYGLHGHPLMGCMAALGSLTAIKRRTGVLLDVPHGALASEYYSISRSVGLPWLRAEMLSMSRQHIDIVAEHDENAGVLAMRGSIRRTQGDCAGAISDYEGVLSRRLGVENALEGQIGEAETELGFALVFAGRRSRGIELIERGIARMEKYPEGGFLVRAKRKLGRAYLRSGAPLRALDALAEAHALAERYQVRDQAGSIDRLAHLIRQHLPIRAAKPKQRLSLGGEGASASQSGQTGPRTIG